MSKITLFISLLLVFDASFAFTCQKDEDCPPFYFCYHFNQIGSRCITNHEVSPDQEEVQCIERGPSGQGQILRHEICGQKEVELYELDDIKFSTWRCFPDLGFKCANGHFGPCTPNFDAQGNVVPGQEESCPENFSCRSRNFKGESAKVCVPNVPQSRDKKCENNFDCPYSRLQDSWPVCMLHNGQCANVDYSQVQVTEEVHQEPEQEHPEQQPQEQQEQQLQHQPQEQQFQNQPQEQQEQQLQHQPQEQQFQNQPQEQQYQQQRQQHTQQYQQAHPQQQHQQHRVRQQNTRPQHPEVPRTNY